MRAKSLAQKGFTLIELMIVVAIVGILAAVALPMLWEAAGKAKKTEAHVQLARLKTRAIEEYTSHATFPQQAAPTTPAVDCCTQNAGSKKKCAVVAADWNTPEWRALEFALNESFYFQYAYTPAGGGSSFQATAIGDTDCDGTSVTFKLDGVIDSGSPKITLTEPTNGD